MSDDIIANYSYSPTWMVRETHKILHLDSSLQPVNNDFAITYDSFWNDYSASLLPVPLICLTLGILAVLIFQCALCSRCCVESCRGLPIHGEETNALNSRYTILLVCFFVFAVGTKAVNQLLIAGASKLTQGVNKGVDGLDYFYDLFSGLVTDGDNLITYGNELDTNLGDAINTGCPEASTLQSYLPTYFDTVDNFLSYVDPVPNICSDASDQLQKFGVDYKNYTVWIMYAAVWICIGIYIGGIFCKKKVVAQLGVGLSELVMIVFFLLVGVIMFLLMGLADYCMDPIIYLNELVPRSVYNITFYYTTCSGTNLLQSDIDSLVTFSQVVGVALNLLNTVCPGNTYIEACFPIATNINTTVNSIVADTACPPIQQQLSGVLESALCTDSFKGMYWIWLGLYIGAVFLMVSTVLMSMLYPYYGEEQQIEEAVAVANPRPYNYKMDGGENPLAL